MHDFAETYKDYELNFTPLRTDDGRFAARFFISGGGLSDELIEPDFPLFLSEEEAARIGRSEARAFVDSRS